MIFTNLKPTDDNKSIHEFKSLIHMCITIELPKPKQAKEA